MFLEKIKNNCLQLKDKAAYICEDKTITYKELWEKASCLAYFLKKDGDSPVIIYGHKNPLMLISILACLISGRTYIPCDDLIPILRVKYYYDKTKAGLILATEAFSDWCLPIINREQINDLCNQNTLYTDSFKEDATAYIMFTSGATGKPKGVPISIRNLDNFIEWITNIPAISNIKSSVVLNQALFSFDLSVADIYISLVQGNTLFATTKKEQSDFPALFKKFDKSKCELMICTPTYMQMCLCDKSFNNILLPNLNSVFFCGEVLPLKVVEKLFVRFPIINIINAYGPTEATCAVSAIEITKDMLKSKCFPIGKLDDFAVSISIVDKKQNVLPTGKYGEIMLCGKSVTDGYIDNNTTAFFIHDNKKYYLTGDRGLIKNGLLYYCGRKDSQVKYKGYRIELSEIETALQALPKVNNAVIIPIYGNNGKVNNLTAVVQKHEDTITSIELTEELLKILPNYMIPKRFEFVSSMPVTKNGKCDRRYLGEYINGKYS